MKKIITFSWKKGTPKEDAYPLLYKYKACNGEIDIDILDEWCDEPFTEDDEWVSIKDLI